MDRWEAYSSMQINISSKKVENRRKIPTRRCVLQEDSEAYIRNETPGYSDKEFQHHLKYSVTNGTFCP